MSLTLNNLKKSRGGLKKRKRVGRGNASGHGTYATKGMKGQRARKGVSNLKRLGMKKQLLKIPKSRGFKSDKPKNQPISVLAINKNFVDQDIVSPATLLAKGLIKTTVEPVKILGKDKLTVKGLQFKNVKMSQGVKDQIKA